MLTRQHEADVQSLAAQKSDSLDQVAMTFLINDGPCREDRKNFWPGSTLRMSGVARLERPSVKGYSIRHHSDAVSRAAGEIAYDVRQTLRARRDGVCLVESRQFRTAPPPDYGRRDPGALLPVRRSKMPGVCSLIIHGIVLVFLAQTSASSPYSGNSTRSTMPASTRSQLVGNATSITPVADQPTQMRPQSVDQRMAAADEKVAAAQPYDVHPMLHVLAFRAHVIGRCDDVDLVTVVGEPMRGFPNVGCNAAGPR